MKQTTAQPTAAQHESVGQRVRRIRKLRGLTIEQLARLTQSSISYISELETNPKRSPSLKKLRAFAEALEVDEGALLDGAKTRGIATEDEQFVARFVALPKETKRLFRDIMDWYIRSRMR
jgi:transcriptional regulator with XRE-family HTH domain